MMQIKRYMALALLGAGLLALAGCQGKNDGRTEVVGALLRNDYEPFLKDYKAGLEAAAAKNNVTLKIYSSNNDAAIQIDQLKTLLLNGVKHFVIIAYNTDLTEQMAKIIGSQGGAAVFSNIIPSKEALRVGKDFFYASSPETDAGAFQAQILDGYFKSHPEKAPGKRVNAVYFNGEYGHPAQIYRRIGVVEGLEKLGYTVNLLTEIGANWSSSSARQSLDLWLEEDHPAFNAVIAQNDEMALGAVESLVKHGYVDNSAFPTRDSDGDGTALSVPVVGVDATEGGRASLANNQLYGTVLQDAALQAETALELVLACMRNGSAQGFTTSSGISAAKDVTKEDPLTDRSLINQCFIVPFLPIKK